MVVNGDGRCGVGEMGRIGARVEHGNDSRGKGGGGRPWGCCEWTGCVYVE